MPYGETWTSQATVAKRISRSYVDLPLETGARIRLPEKSVRHMVRVLRLAVNDQLLLFNGLDGFDYQARISSIGRNEVIADIYGVCGEPEPLPDLRIHLLQGISRGERMDLAMQKATELGVFSITPLFTEHCVSRLSGDRLKKKQSHWQGVVASACEQSGRRRLPTLFSATRFQEWQNTSGTSAVMLDHQADIALPDLPCPYGDILILIGPEGGFSEQEKTAAENSGVKRVRLGPRVMRTETAPLAAIAAIQTCWGDFRR